MIFGRSKKFSEKLVEWLIFGILLLVITHMTVGLGELGPLGWSILGVIFAVFVVVEFVFDFAFDWVFLKLGLRSGEGPLNVTAVVRDDDLVLTLTNDGRDKLMVVAIVGYNERGKQLFAASTSARRAVRIRGEKKKLVRDFPKSRLAGAESVQAALSLPILTTAGAQTLAIVDGNGKEWPVQWSVAAAT